MHCLRPENPVYFFRNIKQVECISKETLRQRTDQGASVVWCMYGRCYGHVIKNELRSFPDEKQRKDQN